MIIYSYLDKVVNKIHYHGKIATDKKKQK